MEEHRWRYKLAKEIVGFNANGGLSVVVDPANANIVYVAGSVMGTWAIDPWQEREYIER